MRIARVLGRLARTSPEEIRFRCAEGARTAAEAVSFATGGERWDRARLGPRLLPRSRDLIEARAALDRDDWSEASAALRSHFLRRDARFLIEPARRPAVRAAVQRLFPSAVTDAVCRAGHVAAGQYDLLGYRALSFGRDAASIDWHHDPVHGRRAPRRFWARVRYLDPRVGDHKIIWELNRHQHWLTLGRAAWLTGNDRYLDRIEAELESWLTANPPLTGINWSSMLELALRSISWIWTLHFLSARVAWREAASLVDLLLGIDRQLDQVARHLSLYFSPNTHLLGEGLALYVGGRVLPELTRAARWEEFGRDILIRQAYTQVRPDGGHAERSTHYHRYTLDFYLLALAVARRTGDPSAAQFEAVASRLASFCRALADDDGRLPTIGDDDGGQLFPICGRTPSDARDSLWIAAELLDKPQLAVGDPPEEALWMLGPGEIALDRAKPTCPPPSHVFPDSGYAVLRAPDAHAILDAGPHGFLNGGHAHGGALSLVLSTHGHPLLIDPGTATYTMDPGVRNRFRSTAMHNTVVVNGRSQSEPEGPFHWKSRAHARVTLWRPGLRLARETVDYAEALHDGYLPLVHRRAVLRAPHGLWVIADHFLGTGHHVVDAYWHLAPGWRRNISESRQSLAHPAGLWAVIDSTGRGRQEFCGDPQGLGWCAPVYGRLVPSLTMRFSDAAVAPFSLITAIATDAAPVRLSVEVTPVAVEREDGWHRAGATLSASGSTFVVIFAAWLGGKDWKDRPRALQRVTLPAGEFATDARMALLPLSPAGEPDSPLLVDASRSTWTARHRSETAMRNAG